MTDAQFKRASQIRWSLAELRSSKVRLESKGTVFERLAGLTEPGFSLDWLRVQSDSLQRSLLDKCEARIAELEAELEAL